MKTLLLHLIGLFLVLWGCFGCSANITQPAPTATTSIPTPSKTVTPTKTTPTETRPVTTAPPTRTPIPPETTSSNTPTPLIPGDWKVPVERVSNWDEYLNTEWKEGNILSIEDYDGPKFQIDAATGEMIPTTPVSPANRINERLSASAEMQITCSRYGLKMIRLDDQSIVSQTELPVENCYKVSWASDGSAAAFVTDTGEVYLWPTDGSGPKKIGEGLSWSTPGWSPDNNQILIFSHLEGNYNPDIVSFSIVNLEGQLLVKPGTLIEAGNEWYGLDWLTNTILRNQIGCEIPNYCLYDYFDGRTGRFIIGNEVTEWSGRKPSISPDGRWLILEASGSDKV